MNKIKGGLSDKLSIEDIAKKFDEKLDFIKKQLSDGIEVEMEHTGDSEKAREIAMDHLSEFPDYYIELAKMEDKLNKRYNQNENIFNAMIDKLIEGKTTIR